MKQHKKGYILKEHVLVQYVCSIRKSSKSGIGFHSTFQNHYVNFDQAASFISFMF